MEVTQKQQILKLLNLDAMIDQYMREPRPYRRQATTSNLNTNKINNNNKNKTNLHQSNNKLMSTLPTNTKPNSVNNARTCSVKTINKKTLDDSLINREKSLTKTYSSRLSRQAKAKSIEPNQQKMNPLGMNYKSTRAISTIANQFREGISKQLTDATFYIKKTENLTTQTNGNDTIDNTQQDDIKTDKIKKQKVKLRMPHFNLQPKREKTILKGRYQLEKLIGRGLSGQVYKARDILSQRFVAIKIIDVNNVEYQFIKQLQHPNMITYYNSFLEDGKRYIVLEYLSKSLSEVVRKRKLEELQVKMIFKAIAAGLLYLHSLSYAHRDIKLDNIVTSDDLTIVKFIDFGLCVDTSQIDSKQIKRFCGTTSYMAPQVISGKCIQPKKADIWSLGVALYILTVGRNPFIGRQQMEIFNKIKNNKTLFPPQMSESLKKLLARMLSKNPEDRPSIYEVVNNQWLDY